MSKFRIVPHRHIEWKVQHRFLGLWLNVTHEIGYGWSELMTFDSEYEAEGWIRTQLAAEERRADNRVEARRRKDGVAPREFP
jgi:hypothetical protein